MRLQAHLAASICSTTLAVLVGVGVTGCPNTIQPKSAGSIAVRVADGICAEEAGNPSEPEWVQLACQVEGAASPIAHVLLPRTEWHAIRARHAGTDAGPGK